MITIEPIWVNYHKHTSLSNRYIKDSAVVNKDYWDELKKRYGDKPCIFTTVEHGWQSNYFHTYNELEKYNKKNRTNIKFVFGTEAYWVKDRHEKDNANCHIILLARNDNGRKAINKILSIANKDGYYYRPRIDLELIKSLPENDVFITTACIAYHNKYDNIDDITLSLANQFPYFYLEIQAHDTKSQIELNRHLLDLSKKHNIPLIAGCDSHYITMDQAIDRDMLLESSNVRYEDEDGWVIDYPTYNTLFKRFQNQSIFTDNEIKTAIDNTNEIFNFEPIILDRSLKVPVIKPLRDKTQEERNKSFENILHDEWESQKWDINHDKYDEYIKEIKDGIKEIEACNMADYFILSYAVMRLGQEKYGGILTPTGRGSAVGMYLNKLLRLTKVDKVNSPVLMYPERFLTKERVLESHTPPDIDNNVSDRQPFIEAQRELVGELGTYDLLAMGTMKKKAAWKMYARANNVDPQIANQVSYQIGDYEEALKYADDGEEVNFEDFIQPEFKQLISECAKYFGIYDNTKGHPCGCLCYDGDAEADIGITLCKSDATGNEVLVVVIESGDIDSFGYLKQDYLIVDSIGLTYDIYKEIGIEPYTVNQLLDKIKTDKATWDIYKDGYTQCVNQCEQAKSTLKVQKYQPKNISELTQFIAAIRPGFKSMYHTFESRQHFEYSIKALDELIQDEFRSSSFIIYQEDLMKVLGFAGFPMAETYTIVKAISKKKDYVIKEAKSKFIPGFSAKIMESDDKLYEKDAINISEKVWGIIEDNAAYGFNSAHSYCMAIDSVTIAYLKAHYPLEFYKCVLQRFTNKGDKDKVSLIKQEMIKRGYHLNEIQFGQDNRQFTIDKSTNSINQCMTSIKSMPKTAPQALYELGQKGIKRRAELYQALMDDNRINIKAIDILFKLDYFSKFSHPNRLLTEYSIYEQNVNKKTINKSKLSDSEIELIRQCAGKETDKQFKEIDNYKLIVELIKNTDIKPTTNLDKIRYQFKLLGYSTIIDNSVDSHIWIVLSTNMDKWNRRFVEMYNVCYGAIREYRINNKFKTKDELNFGDCIKCVLNQKPKKRKTVEGNFVDVPNEFVTEIKCYKILDKYIDKQDKK